jgi:acyl-CoA synthetase (AMP-forming)/AMP-acid ligase II
VEEVVYASGLVGEAVAVGAPHPVLGQAVVVVATAPRGRALDGDGVVGRCRGELPAYMVPQRVVERESLPRNANGKIDRRLLAAEVAELFQESAR